MEETLIATGLTQLQAKAYLTLLDANETSPPALAKQLEITRTNAYKVLDSLVEYGLASKIDVRKKFMYRAADPTALASMVATERNRLIALEQNVKLATDKLRRRYNSNVAKTDVSTGRGTNALIAAYENQAELRSTVYFIKTRSDIPFLGYETMDRLRSLPAGYNTQRHGIVPDGPEGPTDPAIDARTNLSRTWVASEDYTAPIEWSVAGDELLITVFEGDGRLIKIKDTVVADAFVQIWKLLDKQTRIVNGDQVIAPRASRKQ